MKLTIQLEGLSEAATKRLIFRWYATHVYIN